MENEVVIHKGYYWPKKDGSREITSEYAHTDSTCYHLMNLFPNIPDRVSEFVDSKNVMIQAGGNAGFYVKRYSELFSKVYTFEPDPLNFYCLNLNVTSPNVYKYQAFLGDTHSCKSLINTYSSLGHGGSHVNNNSIGNIPTLKIDDLNLETCDLIHLDIEGYELFAVLGAVETLARCKPTVCLEDYDPWKKRYNTSLTEVENILFNIGYQRVGQVEGDTDKVYKVL
jgi:FkbM family methyltransferase